MGCDSLKCRVEVVQGGDSFAGGVEGTRDPLKGSNTGTTILSWGRNGLRRDVGVTPIRLR